MVAFIIADILIILIAIYILSVRGRTNNKNTEKFLNFRYAHRGLHNKPTVPENSLAAFKAAVDNGYAIELDVHLMKDGNIAVIHDASLKRTAGMDVKIEDLTTADLEKFTLEESSEKIPTLNQVLDLVDGKVPLLVEIKPEGNCAAVTAKTVEILKSYKGDYCIESFDPRCILWLKKNAPEIVRGQLTQNFIKAKSELSFFTRLLLTPLVLNCLNRPDFIAVEQTDRKDPQIVLATRLWGVRKFVWTVKSNEDLIMLEKEGFTPIFEQFKP